jgi:hypothetical protein
LAKIDVLKKQTISTQSSPNDTVIAVVAIALPIIKQIICIRRYYLHRNTSVTSSTQQKAFRQRRFLCPQQPKRINILLEALESEAMDLFFNSISSIPCCSKRRLPDYVFEDTAAQLLQNPDLKSFEQNKVILNLVVLRHNLIGFIKNSPTTKKRIWLSSYLSAFFSKKNHQLNYENMSNFAEFAPINSA